MKPKYHQNAALLSAAIYAPTIDAVREELHGLGFLATVAEIFQGPEPLMERAMILPTSDVVYVVFRGTQNWPQWRSNARCGKIPLSPSIPNTKCHHGFRNAVQEVISAVLLELDKWKHHRIVVCGHSRGAAMATLAAQLLDAAGYDLAEVHGFGTPRSLDAKAAQLSDRLFKDRMWRWVANNDVVCRVPFKWMGFRHAGTEMYFDEQDLLIKNPSFYTKALGQYFGRKAGGLFDGVSDHDYVDEYVRLVSKVGQ